MKAFAASFRSIVDNVEQVIIGKTEAVELAVICLLAEGHLLIEDAPGVGKTSLAKALARSVQSEFGRVQFTPDLLPSDVVGTTVWNRAESAFEFRPGPVFAGIMVADEINRASPKTQSALLEAMAERQVTVDGKTYPLHRPFMVIATQNPLEHEGTYPLPESQLDRFLMLVQLGYPSQQAELEILDAHGGANPLETVTAVADPSTVEGLCASAAEVHVAPAVKQYFVELAEATRRHPDVRVGMSTRATLSLQRVSRVLAASQGRDYVLPDDVKRLNDPVLSHRLLLTREALLRGTGPDEVLRQVESSVPVPTG